MLASFAWTQGKLRGTVYRAVSSTCYRQYSIGRNRRTHHTDLMFLIYLKLSIKIHLSRTTFKKTICELAVFDLFTQRTTHWIVTSLSIPNWSFKCRLQQFWPAVYAVVYAGFYQTGPILHVCLRRFTTLIQVQEKYLILYLSKALFCVKLKNVTKICVTRDKRYIHLSKRQPYIN